jgi:hypothetical protein
MEYVVHKYKYVKNVRKLDFSLFLSIGKGPDIQWQYRENRDDGSIAFKAGSDMLYENSVEGKINAMLKYFIEEKPNLININNQTKFDGLFLNGSNVYYGDSSSMNFLFNMMCQKNHQLLIPTAKEVPFHYQEEIDNTNGTFNPISFKLYNNTIGLEKRLN